MAVRQWRGAALTDVGRVRDGNEDSVFSSEAHGVYVVADGMGGHAAGEIASAIASEWIGSRLCEASRTDPGESARVLEATFAGAGREILRQASHDASRAGMGTTATALLLDADGRWTVGHIGDSRAYLYRDGELLRLTRDHSWVQEQVERGVLTPAQAHRHPQSNIITRALGTGVDSVPEIYTGELRGGDRFLLSSDGLTDMLQEERIREILSGAADPETAVSRLVRSANDAGGADNVTAVVVDVEAGTADPS